MSMEPFFIVGIGRSGTTLLRLMMNSHPDIAIPYETHFITDYVERIESYGELNQKDHLKALVDDIIQEDMIKKWDHSFKTDELINRIKEPSLGGVIDAIFQDYAQSKGKKNWGDKSDYLDRMHVINKIFPKAKFIHIVRDGRDVANSVLKMPWGPSDLIQAAEWWHWHIKLGRCMGAILGESRYTEVRYEDLVNDPELELKRLCQFIGIQFSADMLNYHKKNAQELIPDDRKFQHYNTGSAPVKSRTFAWRKEMRPVNVAIFNSYASPSLKELGYEHQPPQVSKYGLLMAKVLIFLKRFV